MSFDHLTVEAQKAANLPNRERLWNIRIDRWIGYSRALKILSQLDEIYEWPKKQRMPNALIIGPTNNGKSMIVEKFRRSHSSPQRNSGDNEVIPILCIQMPPDPSIARFYSMLHAALGAPVARIGRVADLEAVALHILKAVGVRVLIIDELHNILAGKRPAQLEFLNLIRFLGNELRIPIIGVGTRDAYLAIRSDDQLENRFQPIPLPIWQEGDELASLLASFARIFPLRRPSNINDPETIRYVLNRSGGTIGEIATLLSAAAISAVESGEEAINRRSFALAEYESPPERRRSFERALT